MNTSKKQIAVYTPSFRKAGVDHKGETQYEVTMKEIGKADSYADAKKKYGYTAIVDGFAKEIE